MTKAQLQLSQEVVKAIKEAALITGKTPEELIGEAIRAYIYSNYKLTELENYTLADVIKITSALAQLLSTVSGIVELLKGAAPQPEQVQQPPPEEKKEEEETWKLELVKTIRELKEEVEMLRMRSEAVEARPVAAAVPEEFREIQQLLTNYVKNLIKDFILKHMLAKRTTQ